MHSGTLQRPGLADGTSRRSPRKHHPMPEHRNDKRAPETGALSIPVAYLNLNLNLSLYFWLIPDRRQALFPTGLVKVQYSSNLTGSVLLPSTTAPVVSSVV